MSIYTEDMLGCDNKNPPKYTPFLKEHSFSFSRQLQSLSHNLIFTLDSLLKGDLKGVKGVRKTMPFSHPAKCCNLAQK